MIKISWISKGLNPFLDRFSVEYLNRNNIAYTNNIFDADVLLSKTQSKRFRLFSTLFFTKAKLVWTNEPDFDTTTKNFRTKKRSIMNVYSGNVFTNNLHFLGSYHENSFNDLGISINSALLKPMTREIYDRKSRFCVAVYGYHNTDRTHLNINNQDISLRKLRQDLALFFYEKNKISIVGNGWPEHVVIMEESGYQNGEKRWWLRKIELLKDFKFNLCLENTAFPYYCTEKLWHAIIGGCLPVYYGKGTNIYETFTKDSFVDAAEYDSFDDLLTFLEELTPEEYVLRFNRCLEVFYSSWNKRIADENVKYEIIDQFIQEIKRLKN